MASKNLARLRARALPGLAFAVLVAAVYADPLFFRRNFTGRDLSVYNLPMEKAVHDAWARGRLPVWAPHVSGGRPLLPNPNAGALYPPRILLSAAPFPAAMRLFPVLHWIAAGLGMIVLLRSLAASPAASWVGAVTYVFSGVGVGEVFFPHIHPGMALLPWILWAVRGTGRSESGRLFLLSLLYGLLFLAADVFTIGMAVGSSLLWIFVEPERDGRARALGRLAGAVGLAALLAAPQIVATAVWLPETHRAVTGIKLVESVFFSVHPLRLLELAVPFPFGANWALEAGEVWGFRVFRGKAAGTFTTLYAGAFALIALVSSRHARERGFRFARLLLVVSLAASVLPSLIPAAWENVPSPLALRNPEKFVVLAVLALAMLAGLTFDRLRASRESRRWTLAAGAAFAILGAASALFPGVVERASEAWTGTEGAGRVASRRLPGALAEGGLLWMATVAALDRLQRDSRSALWVCVALLTAVPIAANRRIARVVREEEIFAPTPFARFLQREDPGERYRTLGESVYLPSSPSDDGLGLAGAAHPDAERRAWMQHVSALWDRGTVFNVDYDRGDLSRVETLRAVSMFAARHPRGEVFFGSLALRWGVRFKFQAPLPGYRRIGGDVVQDWDENASALPDIRLASAWRETSGGVAALNAMGILEQGEILVETGADARGRSAGGSVETLERTPERLVLATDAPEAGWLFVLRGYWRHRRVLLDGTPVEAVPAQLGFSAVEIPAGRHRVEWTERAPGAELSMWGPVLFGLTLLLVRARRRRRSTPKSSKGLRP